MGIIGISIWLIRVSNLLTNPVLLQVTDIV